MQTHTHIYNRCIERGQGGDEEFLCVCLRLNNDVIMITIGQIMKSNQIEYSFRFVFEDQVYA